jgi:folylpolyglutamate synthase
VRERIQINDSPLSEAQFAKYFFETWDRLEESAKSTGLDPKDPTGKPAYFRFLTLMAYHTFMSEGVDAAIIECGIGGEYDCTNVIEKPIVTGITSLGIDHVPMLGTTIEEIAWQKGGIMKPGAIACTSPQPEAAMAVLRSRAKEKGVALHVATAHPDREPGNPAAVRLGLSGDVQYKNAELAVCICNAFLRKLGFSNIPTDITTSPLPPKFKQGLETVQLGGRCEIRIEGNVAWHIDGGHTLDSIEATGKWYSSQPCSREVADKSKPRVLIFNQQTRDSTSLARALHETLPAAGNCSFTHAIFCTNVTFKEAGYKPDLFSMNTSASDVEKLSVQTNLAKVWKELSPNTEVAALPTIEEAVQFVRGLAATERNKGAESEKDQVAVSVLVTGSLHLVGGLLEVLETLPADR